MEKTRPSNGTAITMKNNISKHFPFKTNNPDLVYFDNASTTQKPDVVIDSVMEHLSGVCANPYRSSYGAAYLAESKIQKVRNKVAKFINAKPNEIFFTSGSTEGITKIMSIFKNNIVRNRDEIMYCPKDHQSLVNPIKSAFEKENLVLYDVFPHSGDADWRDILDKANDNTRLIAITHVHPMYGLQSEPEKLIDNLSTDCMILLDATQSVGHISLDVNKLGVDCMVFSGHKMFSLEGVGVVYISEKIQSIANMNDNNNYFEKGTLPITSIISLGSAIDFITEIGLENISTHSVYLTQYLLSKLREIPEVEFLPGVANAKCATGYGILSFRLKGISSDDLSFVLDSNNICVRSGHSCMHNSSSVENSIRVSMHIYNTTEDVDKLIDTLKQLKL